MSYELNELDRRLANIVRVGAIAEVDHEHAMATVDLGDLTTEWLPWLTLRAGDSRTWWAPSEGEQVLVLAPSGELAQGVIVPGLYQDDHPQNGSSGNIQRTTYSDGSVVQYDTDAHQLTVTVGTGSVVVNCSTATVNGNVHVNSGTVTVTGGDVIADGISLKTHKHGGVVPGGGQTGVPA